MSRNLRIGDLVSVPRVRRSSVWNGHRQSEAASAGFVFTPEVAEFLARPHGQGFFMQGDFGSGKSHFLG